ncbi:DNA polymerase III subunit beta [Alsobacter sp. SYSU BS001988]
MLQAMISRATFNAALTFAKRVTDRRTHIPVLANARLRAMNGAVQLITTDLDREIRVTLDGASADAGFDVTLPTHQLADMVKKTASEFVAIDFQANAERAALDFEGARVSLHTLPVANFPEFPGLSAPDMTTFSMMSDVLGDAFGRTEWAVSTEATRWYPNGIYVHTINVNGARMLRMVTTDGHRMAVWTGDLPAELADYGDGFPGFIVPAATVKDVLALMGKRKPPVLVTVTLSRGTADKPAYVTFACGNVEIRSKLIDGTFPDYQRVMPSTFDKRLRVNREAFASLVERVSVISSERGRAVKLDLEADGDGSGSIVTASVTHSQNGSASDSMLAIAVTWGGSSALQIGFNAGYLLGIMKQFSSDDVELHLNDPGSPIRVDTPTSAHLVVVVTPMRV